MALNSQRCEQMDMKLPNCLTVAGSDSGGGAGIQADLKTFTTLGVYGMSVITALTAQNGEEVRGIFSSSPEFVALQMETVFDGFPVHAAKTGMLFSKDIIDVVAKHFAGKTFPLVVDPVCVSQSGYKLVEEDAVEAIRRDLIPLADLLTPNRPEAEELTGIQVRTKEDILRAGKALIDMGASAVLIKGGHFDEKPIFITDWLFTRTEEPAALRQPYVETSNNHGTGCTLSSAITAYLAKGLPLKPAVTNAQEYLNYALRHSYAPGKGCGPVNHVSTMDRR